MEIGPRFKDGVIRKTGEARNQFRDVWFTRRMELHVFVLTEDFVG